jgi:hypothetical protein
MTPDEQIAHREAQNPLTPDVTAFVRKSLVGNGFEGFVTFDDLRSGLTREVPESGGGLHRAT